MRQEWIGEGCHFSSDQPDGRFLSTKAAPTYAPHRQFQPLHVMLEARVDVKKRKMEAVCTTNVLLFGKEKEIGFDAVELHIEGVQVNGKKTNFRVEKEEEKIWIDATKINEKASICITYSLCNPRLGIFFIHPTKHQPNKPYQAWTHSETEQARFWYPCVDQPEVKCPIEMKITVEKPFRAIANGVLVSTKNSEEKWNTFHWKFDEPNPSYLNAFMIGDFAEVKDTFGKTDVLYYCEKGKEEDIKRAFGNTPKMMKFFSEFTQYTYPHKKYAQVAVADFLYGGMEHTTCTTQTDLYLQDEIAHNEYWYPGEMLASHELAHQWFGDLITCRDWSHGWLNESFATYFKSLWIEHHFGKDEFHYELFQDYRSYIEEDKNKYRRPIVTNVYAEPGDIFDRHLYEKGALLLHSIRHIVGEEGFKKSIQHYVKNNANKTVTTEDLLASFREVTGKNLTQFFDEFIYRGGHPELRVTCHYDAKKKEAVMRVIQSQSGELYHFPVKIILYPKSGKPILEEKTVKEKENTFTFKMNAMPRNMVFDSDVSILKTINQTKPREMWYEQLVHDPHVVHRISAAGEIAKYASEKDVLLLEKSMTHDPFWGVRAEAAIAMGTTKLQNAYKKIMQAFPHEKDNRVKQVMLRALGEYASHDIHDFLLKQIKHANSYIIPAEAYTSIGKSRNAEKLSVIEKGMKEKSWIDVIPIGAIKGLAALQTEEAMHTLLKYAHPKYSNRIRQAVATNLGTIGKGRDAALWKLIELTQDNYINLQIAAAISLGELGDSRAIPTLQKLQEGHRDPRIIRTALESIRKINGVLELPPKKEEKSRKN
ncbi:MAG: M1 family aminopeptidase [Candidatus Diapherotrites archaeon]